MRVACAQSSVVFGQPVENANAAIAKLHLLKRQGVELAVFPEAYLTGYCVETAEAAREIAIPRDQESLRLLESSANELGIIVIIGFAELNGNSVFNTAVLFEPGIAPRYYSKTHLPELGLDHFVTPGSELNVFETAVGKIGILICYDMRPPEATRVLVLEGADLVVLPTNWPVGAETSAEHICIARASENRVFYATCNRVGDENGFHFIGRSKIIHPSGKVLAEAGSEEELIVADINLEVARQKRTVNIPGKYELDVIESRRPELYNPIIRTH